MRIGLSRAGSLWNVIAASVGLVSSLSTGTDLVVMTCVISREKKRSSLYTSVSDSYIYCSFPFCDSLLHPVLALSSSIDVESHLEFPRSRRQMMGMLFAYFCARHVFPLLLVLLIYSVFPGVAVVVAPYQPFLWQPVAYAQKQLAGWSSSPRICRHQLRVLAVCEAFEAPTASQSKPVVLLVAVRLCRNLPWPRDQGVVA